MKPELLTSEELEKIKRCLGYEARMIDDGILYGKIVKLNEWVKEIEFEEEEGFEYEPVGPYYVAVQQEFEADQFMSAGWEDDDA